MEPKPKRNDPSVGEAAPGNAVRYDCRHTGRACLGLALATYFEWFSPETRAVRFCP